MGKMQRMKGKRGELEVVHFWCDIFGNAKRILEYQAGEGVDVQLGKYYACQVKSGSHVPVKLYKWLKECKTPQGRMDWLQIRRDREEWLCVLKAEDFKEILALLKAHVGNL